MSRRLLVPRPEFESCEIVVGWDERSATFYGFVLDRAAGLEEQNPWLVFVGGPRAEVRSAAIAVDAVRRYAVIKPDLVDELEAEMKESTSASSTGSSASGGGWADAGGISGRVDG